MAEEEAGGRGQEVNFVSAELKIPLSSVEGWARSLEA